MADNGSLLLILHSQYMLIHGGLPLFDPVTTEILIPAVALAAQDRRTAPGSSNSVCSVGITRSLSMEDQERAEMRRIRIPNSNKSSWRLSRRQDCQL